MPKKKQSLNFRKISLMLCIGSYFFLFKGLEEKNEERDDNGDLDEESYY